MIERVSIECRKTKTKVITLANQKDGNNPVNQSKLEVITRSRHKARENVYARATIGFGFTSDWLKILNQSLSEVMQNQSNSLITLDTQLKTVLKSVYKNFKYLPCVTGQPIWSPQASFSSKEAYFLSLFLCC